MSRGSSGSMTWCLVVALSLLLVARVQPYPGYGERLRSALRYQAQVQALGDRRTAAAATTNNHNNNHNNQATSTTTHDDDYDEGDDIEENDYPRPYDYNDFLAERREPDIFPYDQVSERRDKVMSVNAYTPSIAISTIVRGKHKFAP